MYGLSQSRARFLSVVQMSEAKCVLEVSNVLAHGSFNQFLVFVRFS